MQLQSAENWTVLVEFAATGPFAKATRQITATAGYDRASELG